jgi:hypothetical protein
MISTWLLCGRSILPSSSAVFPRVVNNRRDKGGIRPPLFRLRCVAAGYFDVSLNFAVALETPSADSIVIS